MLTAIVSDLHLGMKAGTDIALRPPVRERLAQALEGADRIVLLGDLLELRERPDGERCSSWPLRCSTRIGEAAAGKQVRDRARQPRPRPRGPGARRGAPGRAGPAAARAHVLA